MFYEIECCINEIGRGCKCWEYNVFFFLIIFKSVSYIIFDIFNYMIGFIFIFR